jgi:ribosomal-protein-alanine N-acetyltransferase
MARTQQIDRESVPSGASRFVLRPMTAADIPQVTDIDRESFPTMWPPTAFGRELRNRLARYFVLVEDSDGGPAPEQAPAPTGSPWRRAMRRLLRREPEPPPTRELIIGVAGFWMMVDELHIVTIAVREAFRRQGAGELLIMSAIEFAMVHGMDAVTLEYRRSNELARALYEKYGFIQVGMRPRYYSDNNEDAVIMTTPPILSRSQQELYWRRKAEHRKRWGDRYRLPESF